MNCEQPSLGALCKVGAQSRKVKQTAGWGLCCSWDFLLLEHLPWHLGSGAGFVSSFLGPSIHSAVFAFVSGPGKHLSVRYLVQAYLTASTTQNSPPPPKPGQGSLRQRNWLSFAFQQP